MKTTQVIHWETKELIEIINNETYELSIPQKYFEKWQNSINIIESLVNVSSVLLRTLEENNLIVRACSNNKNNPFSLNDKKALLTGSCCETLIANNSSLYIEDNQKNLKWKDNLDFISNLKSYLGLPLYWPNKEIFGTICLYNDNNIPFENFLILEEFQESIQKDLSIIFLKNENKNLTHELDMAIRSKKYFLSALTNDLRKPLFGLMGLIDLNVQKDFQDIELNNDFKLLKDSAEYLKTVIDNTLDFGYIRHEDFRLNQNLITTDKLFKQVIDINNFTFEHKGQKFVSNYRKLPIRNIYVDRMRFIQIASNLLTLASKSCIEGGSIFLNIRESFIDSEWITYDVCVEDRDYNENKDYTVQIDRPLSTNLHHISKDNADFHLLKILVEAMGGGISISGNKDSDIKYCLSMSFKYQPLQIKEEQIVKPYFKNKKALVVENNKISQRVIIRMLEKLGFENEVSSNGQDALNIFKNSKDNEYNLIITDSDLPIMDGYQVCKKIRELNRLDSKDVSIILISDKLTEDVIKKKEFFGVDTLLLKPIEENRVHQNIINLLNR